MEHTNKAGESKVLKRMHLAAHRRTQCVDMIISDLCRPHPERGKTGLTLIELAPGVTLDEVTAKTEASLSKRALEPAVLFILHS